jgi:hypothetical protein
MPLSLINFAGMPIGVSDSEKLRRDYYKDPGRFPGADRPIFDAFLKKYVSSKTGVNWNGPITGNGGAVLGHAINGDYSSTPGPSTGTGTGADAIPDFSVTHTVRQPAIAALTDALTKQAAQQSASTNLSDTLPGLQDIATRTYTQGQAANDVAPLEAQLTGSMTAQEKAQRGLAADQAQRNKDYTSETNSMLAKLSAENARWESTTNAIGERAGAAAVTSANLIPLQTGQNPVTRSGAQPGRVAVALANALLPTQQAISARRYAQVANIEQPWRQNLYQQDSALIASNQALESSFGGNWRSIHQYIQSVKAQAAQMDAANAERYIAQALNFARIPMEFLGTQISMASALQRLDDLATEHLVSQPVDTSQFASGPGIALPGIDRSGRPTQQNPQVLPRNVALAGGGGGGFQPNYPAGGFVPPTTKQLREAYAKSQQYRPTVPVDPWRDSTGSGWGSVNGEYIGAGADWWNDAMIGQLQDLGPVNL